MGANKKKFNKKLLSILIEKARGDRTAKKYAEDCRISYVQLHKLETGAQENPPGLKILTKLARNSACDIELSDFLFVCGYNCEDDEPKTKTVSKGRSIDIQSLYNLLSAGQKKTVYDFVDYLLNYKGK